MARILVWLLVALVLYVLDKKFFKRESKLIWYILFVVGLIATLLMQNYSSVFLDDILAIIIAFSTVSILAKKEEK